MSQKAIHIRPVLGFDLLHLGREFAQENILNLGRGEVSGEIRRGGGEQFLGGQTLGRGGQSGEQYGSNLGDEFRTGGGGGLLALGLGGVRGGMGLGHLFKHLGQGFHDLIILVRLGQSGDSGGQSIFLGHSVTFLV